MKTTYLRIAAMGVLLGLAAAAGAEGLSQRLRVRVVPKPPAATASAALASDAAKAAKAADTLPSVCPTDAAGWTDWRERAIAYLLALHAPDADERKAGQRTPYLRHEDVLDRSSFLVVALDRCAALGAVPPPRIVDNLGAFVRSQHNANFQLPNPQHQFGHGPVLTDEDYLCKAEPALELPCLLRSQEFLGALQSPRGYAKAHRMILDRNAGRPAAECASEPVGEPWDVLLYRSRLLTTPDDAQTLGRFLVVAPGSGGQPDRWVQFGIWPPEDAHRHKTPIQNVSIVAVAKTRGDVPDANALLGYDAIADWFRCKDGQCDTQRADDGATLGRNACMKPQPAGAPITLRYRLAVTGETDDCQRCHKMMPLSIHPKRVYEVAGGRLRVARPAAAASAVQAINQRIQDDVYYGRAPATQIDASDTAARWQNYGTVGFGWSPGNALDGAAARADGSIDACSAPYRLGPDAKRRVLDAMACDSCHDGRQWGLLNYPQATDKRTPIEAKVGSPVGPNMIRSHILHGVMPLAPDTMQPVALSMPERHALYACLSQEYFDPAGRAGLFVDWLRDADPQALPTLLAVSTKAAAPAGPHTLAAAAGAQPGTPEGDFDAAKCAQCHDVRAGGANRRGPNLAGVVGRRLASTNFARYSSGLLELGRRNQTWDDTSLMAFLQDPDAYLAQQLGQPQHSAMNRRIALEAMRRNIVAYLATLK